MVNLSLMIVTVAIAQLPLEVHSCVFTDDRFIVRCDALYLATDIDNYSAMLGVFQKLWFQHIWPCLQQEMKTQEVLAAVLQPIIFLVQECTIEEYESVILPSFR
jgi:hypothetical protein